jgi:hypothetical protein
MFQMSRLLLVLAALALVCGTSIADSTDDQLSGTILGKTGELLDIRLDQPVCEGTVFDVRPIVSEPPIAQAKVVSCTREWPYVALAKVYQADSRTVIPIGAKAFANLNSIDPTAAPRQKIWYDPQPDPMRFSVQAGTFYPRIPNVRLKTTDFWQEYRMNYSFLRLKNFEFTFSGAYAKGEGSTITSTGKTYNKIEIIPITLLGRLRLVKVGTLRLVVGGGAGVYRIRSGSTISGVKSHDTTDKFGQELSAGIESSKGWLLELRYRNVPDTDIQGFSLALGGRF